jgi:hypothetical protein
MSLTILFWGYILCSLIMILSLMSLSVWLHSNEDEKENTHLKNESKRN